MRLGPVNGGLVQLGKELWSRFKAKSITLPRKGVKNGEVVQKEVYGKCPVLEAPVPAAPRSSAQYGALAQKIES